MYDITKHTSPKMPSLGNGTECIKILLSQASKDMYKPLVPMLFPVLGAHMALIRRNDMLSDELQNHQQGLEIKRAYLHGDSVVTPSQVHEKVLHRHLFQSFTI